MAASCQDPNHHTRDVLSSIQQLRHQQNVEIAVNKQKCIIKEAEYCYSVLTKTPVQCVCVCVCLFLVYTLTETQLTHLRTPSTDVSYCKWRRKHKEYNQQHADNVEWHEICISTLLSTIVLENLPAQEHHMSTLCVCRNFEEHKIHRFYCNVQFNLKLKCENLMLEIFREMTFHCSNRIHTMCYSHEYYRSIQWSKLTISIKGLVVNSLHTQLFVKAEANLQNRQHPHN